MSSSSSQNVIDIDRDTMAETDEEGVKSKHFFSEGANRFNHKKQYEYYSTGSNLDSEENAWIKLGNEDYEKRVLELSQSIAAMYSHGTYHKDENAEAISYLEHYHSELIKAGADVDKEFAQDEKLDQLLNGKFMQMNRKHLFEVLKTVFNIRSLLQSSRSVVDLSDMDQVNVEYNSSDYMKNEIEINKKRFNIHAPRNRSDSEEEVDYTKKGDTLRDGSDSEKVHYMKIAPGKKKKTTGDSLYPSRDRTDSEEVDCVKNTPGKKRKRVGDTKYPSRDSCDPDEADSNNPPSQHQRKRPLYTAHSPSSSSSNSSDLDKNIDSDSDGSQTEKRKLYLLVEGELRGIVKNDLLGINDSYVHVLRVLDQCWSFEEAKQKRDKLIHARSGRYNEKYEVFILPSLPFTVSV
mmetsp:Transcript_942/g.1495  ORF Transcript_942/g.1495 Transcript_942/m.1495 type:complete len:405 (+) Transcript_942:118-1332(+)